MAWRKEAEAGAVTTNRTRFVALLGLALLVVPLGSWSAPAQEARYPAWFRSMPTSEQGLWAVGYARAYDALEATMEPAKADAYERLRRGRRVILRGEKLYESAPGFQTSFEGANFTETGLPDTLRSVTYVDSLHAGGMTLVLAAWTPEDSSSTDGSLVAGPIPSSRAPFSETPPSWVQTEVEGGPNKARAVGRASRYYYLENSWRRAEKQARRKLAFKAATKIRRLEKSTEDWQHDVMSVQTRVRLRRVQAVARWADEETCYVLAEGVVEDVLIE